MLVRALTNNVVCKLAQEHRLLLALLLDRVQDGLRAGLLGLGVAQLLQLVLVGQQLVEDLGGLLGGGVLGLAALGLGSACVVVLLLPRLLVANEAILGSA